MIFGRDLFGNCDIKIMMGTNDLLTAEYISELLGVSTVGTNSIRKGAEFDGILDYGNVSISSVKRNVMNKDEALRMDNDIQIVYLRGYKAFKCKKLRYWEHPLGSDIQLNSIENYKPNNITTLSSIKEKEEPQKLPTFEEFLRGRRKIG